MDNYLKAVLTVIALALAVIAFRMPTPTAYALGDGCGSLREPCYIETTHSTGLNVWVQNPPR